MRKTITLITALIGMALMSSCGSPAANNTAANKPANAANNASAKPAADSAAVEADVKKFISDFEVALNKNDADAVGKFYNDDYTLIDQDGVMQTKASRVEQIRSGKVKWEGLKFADTKVRAHPAGDGAVVYAHATGKTTIDGKTGDRNSMVTWVVRKGADGWHFLHAQITDVKGGASKPANETPAAANTAPANK
ncbi:MAG: nuclear transport factor 2 family protein [bacterium]|nr:nuclear transport factor 2 family protein [bacterium]